MGYDYSMMTKRDFEAIAHTLNANRAPLALVEDMADTMEDRNPRFDRVRFVQASTENIKGDLAFETRMLDTARKGRA